MLDSELLHLVGMIYDAALEPSRWYSAIDAVRARLGFFNSMMTLIDVPTGRTIVGVEVNVPAEYEFARAPEYVNDILKLWGGPAAFSRHVVEEPMILSDVSDVSTWEDNLYYRHFAKPQGIIDVLALPLVRDRNLAGDLGFGRHASAGRPGPAQVEDLRLLAPHIRRAALVSGILDAAAGALATFEAAIEATPAGVVLVDRDMRIVHANASALSMMEESDPVREVAGRLELRLEILPGQLAGAVLAAAADPLAIGRRGIGIPARRADGSPLVLHVMPLTPRAVRSTSERAVAAVFIAETTSMGAGRGDALGLLFGLTPAEARVFELIAAGSSSRQIADALGVATSTIKTHILHVFEKTGRHSKAELVGLARDLRLPA
jgi:DNA-binding CsgD family transcriptional regulator